MKFKPYFFNNISLNSIRKQSTAALLIILSWVVINQSAQANPAFARQYGVSCMTCHAAFPRLNSFGEQFLADNIACLTDANPLALIQATSA